MCVHKCAGVRVGAFWGRKQLWSNLSGISCYIYCGKWNLLIRSAFFHMTMDWKDSVPEMTCSFQLV